MSQVIEFGLAKTRVADLRILQEDCASALAAFGAAATTVRKKLRAGQYPTEAERDLEDAARLRLLAAQRQLLDA